MQALTEEQLQALYTWIDTIPLSRPKRNLTRDFSDGVAGAEVVHHFFPKLVELHNYSPANALTQKLYNWNTLNQKVLRKLGYLVADDAIQGIINNKPGYAEWVLNELRTKIDAHAAQQRAPATANVAMNGLPIMNMNGMIADPPMMMPPHNALGMGMLNPLMGYASAAQAPMNPHFVYQYPPALPVSAPPAMQPPVQQLPAKSYSNAVSATQPATRKKLQSTGEGGGSTVVELQETIQILQLKVQKMDQLLTLKDKRIEDLTNRLRQHGIPS
ncbi:hypothetical protein SeLEV6574_g03660 [Synchytrium endobioticum]|uniref:Calponin-homology (CH) domain-containing protein n=1 Tax=Synchytrium endobioticum TaxID=286115 RepID=A0A507D2T3_9FUNG|nr:hypothetical protein SeLEV6574_g03660 [Synchytrium endobioticum]